MTTGALVHAEAIPSVFVTLHAPEASVRLALWNVGVRIGVVALADLRSGSLSETICETSAPNYLCVIHR